VIVLDASAVLELLLGTPPGRAIAARIQDPALALHVPHVLDVEVAQVLRRYTREGQLEAAEAAEALDALRTLDLERHAHEPLLDRIWALRQNLTAYDAAYVALAEALDAVLLTCDRRLARATASSRRVELQLAAPTDVRSRSASRARPPDWEECRRSRSPLGRSSKET
jgi:predicted nucleic acid-binding protein